MQQLFDLFARQFTPPREFAQHALAVRTCLVDHLAALLFGHREFGLGIGSSVGASTRRLDLGLFAHPSRFVAGLAQQLCGRLLRLLTNLDRTLACGGEYAGGLLAQQAGQRGVVELCRRQIGVGLCGAQLALEKAFALLESAEFGRDHPQEIAYFGLVEPASAGTETGVGNRRRR